MSQGHLWSLQLTLREQLFLEPSYLSFLKYIHSSKMNYTVKPNSVTTCGAILEVTTIAAIKLH